MTSITPGVPISLKSTVQKSCFSRVILQFHFSVPGLVRMAWNLTGVASPWMSVMMSGRRSTSSSGLRRSSTGALPERSVSPHLAVIVNDTGEGGWTSGIGPRRIRGLDRDRLPGVPHITAWLVSSQSLLPANSTVAVASRFTVPAPPAPPWTTLALSTVESLPSGRIALLPPSNS